MTRHQTLPLLWLISDARNDAALEDALQALPPGSGFVFRHYHLAPEDRRRRYERLALLARAHGHLVALAADAVTARAWGADAVYGPPEALGPPQGLLRLATAHDGAELQRAEDSAADAVFLSPVFATASHPDARELGTMGFSVLSQQVSIPVIALGGMTAERARFMNWPRWAAIDGLTHRA